MTTMSIEQRKNIRDELNEAIWKVITTQYKKDAKEAHEMVSAFGFHIRKNDGHYRVSGVDHRVVYVSWEGYRKMDIDLAGINIQGVEVCYGEKCKVDFVGFLSKHNNRAYQESKWVSSQESQALLRYDRLDDTKRMIKWYEEDIEKAKKEIEALINKVASLSESKNSYEKKLAEQRVEYGLV